jgi:hypothetical protein
LERSESSTAREMRGILFAVQSFEWAIKGRKVIVQCDNQGAVAISAKGSPVPGLNTIAIELAEFCASIGAELQVIWVPRGLNVEADAASRLDDSDNWGIRENVVDVCQGKWGRVTVDRFADHENAVCTRFNSRYFVPRTEAVDCFGEDWRGEFNWVVPPIALAGRALQYMLATGAEGILGVPDWKGSPFFALLVDDLGNWRPFIAGVIRFPVGTLLFRPDKEPTSAFAGPFANFPFLFLRIQPLAMVSHSALPTHKATS